MYWFLFIFFSIYGIMHSYMYIKIKKAFALKPFHKILLVLFMLLMITAPLTIRFLGVGGFYKLSFIMYFIGYGWLAVLFLFLSFSIVIDLYVVAFKLLTFFTKRKSAPALSNKKRFFIPLIITAAVFIYGWGEARNVRIKEIEIFSSKLPLSVNELKIVQITDLHLGIIINEKRIKSISAKIQSLNPDIIVSTGDLIDGRIYYNQKIMDLFNNKKTRYGKYASMGNHEFFVGIDKSVRLTEEAGFFLLRNKVITIPGVINIAGVDDETALRYGLKEIKEESVLEDADESLFTLLLKHRPEINESSLGKFDLQLSGHSHGGQIFPFTLISKIVYPYLAGFYELDKGSNLYVSRGTGLWGPPIRFLAPPEITLIRVKSVDN